MRRRSTRFRLQHSLAPSTCLQRALAHRTRATRKGGRSFAEREVARRGIDWDAVVWDLLERSRAADSRLTADRISSVPVTHRRRTRQDSALALDNGVRRWLYLRLR